MAERNDFKHWPMCGSCPRQAKTGLSRESGFCGWHHSLRPSTSSIVLCLVADTSSVAVGRRMVSVVSPNLSMKARTSYQLMSVAHLREAECSPNWPRVLAISNCKIGRLRRYNSAPELAPNSTHGSSVADSTCRSFDETDDHTVDEFGHAVNCTCVFAYMCYYVVMKKTVPLQTDAPMAAEALMSGSATQLRIIVTGGTFDKEYSELDGQLYFRDSHVDEMLSLGRSTVPVEVEILMLIDSLDMTLEHRRSIERACAEADQDRIVITHGTDTMQDTARFLEETAQRTGKTIVLTGAMVPYKFGSSDGLFNLGSALAFAQTLAPGVYVAMNGRYFGASKVRKNRKVGRFENSAGNVAA